MYTLICHEEIEQDKIKLVLVYTNPQYAKHSGRQYLFTQILDVRENRLDEASRKDFWQRKGRAVIGWHFKDMDEVKTYIADVYTAV